MPTLGQHITKSYEDDGPDYTPEMIARMKKRAIERGRMVPTENVDYPRQKTFADSIKPKKG